jgi:DNA polymerase
MKSYTDFRATLITSNCVQCDLSKSRTNIVADRGNPASKVLIIGEAPGRNEDLEGRAFVGRSGRLLDQMMKDIGFDTEKDCLIVNVVKCRPPANRAPRPIEVAACFPFLKKQIELVKPRFILLLGATALKHVSPDRKGLSMESQVGNFFEHAEYPGIQFMTLYHPAYILRDPRKKPLMAAHLKRFRDTWEKKN